MENLIQPEGSLRLMPAESLSEKIAALPSLYQEVLEHWLLEGGRRETTCQDYSKIWISFIEFSEHRAIERISRRDLLLFRDELLKRGQHPVTVSRKLGVLKALFRVAQDYEIVANNPAERIRVRKPVSEKPRLAFSLEDLQRIFNSPIYRQSYRAKSGGGDACFWLPLLALFTGCRVEELAQLLVEDIRWDPEHGPYINISDDAPHAHLKNASSRRRIPIHPQLLDMGLIRYADSVREEGFLFPDLKANPRGKLGGYFSNFFSGYLRNTVGISDRRKVFHSFRHTFKENCRLSGIDEEVHDALTGHTRPGASRRYGNALYPLPPLFAALRRWQIPGLDLKHLSATKKESCTITSTKFESPSLLW